MPDKPDKGHDGFLSRSHGDAEMMLELTKKLEACGETLPIFLTQIFANYRDFSGSKQ